MATIAWPTIAQIGEFNRARYWIFRVEHMWDKDIVPKILDLANWESDDHGGYMLNIYPPSEKAKPSNTELFAHDEFYDSIKKVAAAAGCPYTVASCTQHGKMHLRITCEHDTSTRAI